MYHSFFICFSVSGHLGCFNVLVIVNSAAINIGMHVSFWIMVFLRHIPRSWIAQWYDSSICSVLSNLHTALPIAAPTHLVTNSVREFPFLHTLFVYRFFLLMAILTCVRWYLIIVLVCISLRNSDVEHLFMCLLANCISFLEKCVFRSTTQFFFDVFFLYWAPWTVHFEINPNQWLHLQIFSPILSVKTIVNWWYSIIFCL